MKRIYRNSDNSHYVNINYQKLADTIIAANKQSRQTRHDSIRIKMMNRFNSFSMILMCFICTTTIWSIWTKWNSILAMSGKILFTLLLSVFAILFFLAEQESFSDDSIETKDYFLMTTSFTSLLIAFASLIISLQMFSH